MEMVLTDGLRSSEWYPDGCHLSGAKCPREKTRSETHCESGEPAVLLPDRLLMPP